MKELYDLRDMFHSTESRMKEIMSEYEKKLKEEEWQKMEAEERHQMIMTQLENTLQIRSETLFIGGRVSHNWLF